MIHKTTRSILSVLLAVLLLVTSIPLTPAFADGGAVSPQSESGESRALTGDGTKEKPYQIATANDLREFAKLVNDDETTAYAVLTANIDLSSVCGPELNDGTSWEPIGNSINQYRGTFDGNEKTISGLYIDSSSADYQGLFGYVGTRGTVRNLTVSGSVKGDDYVGGVVGYNDEGRVENCHNIGSVSGDRYVGGVVGDNRGTVKNCHNIGAVSGNSVGGVVGDNIGSVTNCYNTGAVNSSGNYVGGVVGDNGGTVKNCYNTGAVNSSGNYVGGVVGDNYDGASVENCYNTGAVNSSGNRVGGVVGWNDEGRVENCYNTGAVSGNSSVGGVVGLNSSSSTVTGCYFLQDTAGSGIGSDEAIGATAESVNDLDTLCDKFKDDTTWSISPFCKHPVLKANPEGGDGTKEHPYEIKTAAQLETFRVLVNDGKDGQAANPNAHAKLMENIDLNPGITFNADGTYFSPAGVAPQEWTPIGNSEENAYTGTFNGNGNTISGLYIDSATGYQGLFGRVNGGTVKDLSVSGSVKGNWYVGGVVGYNRSGTVENCYNTGSVTGSSDYSYIGGVVGDNSGTVKNCYNIGSVTATGSDGRVGGVVGYNSGPVKNCYNTGTVSDGTTSGGVVGQNFGSGSVTNCYFLQTADVNKDLPGIGENYGRGDATEKDDTAFHSGEVAYLLQNGQKAAGAGEPIPLVWGQSKLGETTSLPTLVALDKNAKTVYQVTLKYDHAGAQDKTYYTDDTATPSEQPFRDGYTFDHWDKTEGEGNTITYTAQWTPHTYSITASPSTLNFGSITEGEERPAAQTVTVKNTGNQTVTLNQPTATNFEIAKIDDLALDAGESVKLTIQPKDKLPRGSYSEQIAISNTNGEKATITATFTVKEPPYTGKYSYEVFTSVGDNGTVTVDRYATEGDKVTIDVTPDQAYKLDDLSVTANGKDVELTANSDGTYSFTMPSADVKISATFAEDPDWTEPEEPATDVSDIFLDVAPNAWYKDAVQYAYDNGLMTGVSDTEFAPEATTTRAMIVSILARLEGVESAQAAGFADVNDEWYATAVNWAANVGVVNGYEDGTFKPNTAITREQLAAILMNYAAYKGEDVSNRADLTSYTDQPSTWAEEAISWSVAEGLLTGVTADTLQPQGAATRAQVAAILERFLAQ